MTWCPYSVCIFILDRLIDAKGIGKRESEHVCWYYVVYYEAEELEGPDKSGGVC